MKKIVRSFALVAALTLSAVPAMHAGRWGTNPVPMSPDGGFNVIQDAILFNLGML